MSDVLLHRCKDGLPQVSELRPQGRKQVAVGLGSPAKALIQWSDDRAVP